MKLIKTEGCVCNNLDVDGEDINELSKDKIEEIFNKLPKSKEFLIQCIDNYIEQNIESKYLYTCEDCGDSVYEYVCEI